jgi:flagellar export protein FliJ
LSQIKQLIRLHRFILDDKRRLLKDLQSLREHLKEALLRLDAELDSEQAKVDASPELTFSYGDYVAAVQDRRTRLVESVAESEQQIEQAREAVTAAFQELKKYEITRANRERMVAERTARLEQANLDEIGLSIYRRRRRDVG